MFCQNGILALSNLLAFPLRLLQLVRNHTPYTVILLAIFTLLIKLPALAIGIMPVALPNQVLYSWVLDALHHVIGAGGFGYTFIAVGMLFGQALYLTAIAGHQKLFGYKAYLPAFAYLIFTSLEPDYSHFSAPLLANWCILGALDMMMKLPQLQPRKQLFNMGFLVALAALLQFPAIVLIFWFLMAMLLLRPFNLSEWMVGLLGCFTPLYFFCGILFLTNKLFLLRLWARFGFSVPRHVVHPVHLMGVIVAAVILVSCGIFALQAQMSKTAVSARRYWSAIGICTFTCIAAAVFSPAKAPCSWMMAMPSFSLLAIPPMYGGGKSKRFPLIVFWLFIALLLFSLFITNK